MPRPTNSCLILTLTFVSFLYNVIHAANTSDSDRITGTVLTPSIPLGGPITITWSIVPDGTDLPSFSNAASDPDPKSDLIARMDSIYGVAVVDQTADLTNRPWFAVFA
jgi:hypothetical protein